MNKCRIVKRTLVDGRIKYVIQQRHFLFRWWWVDAWINYGPDCEDSFNTLAEAQEKLCYFDDTKIKNEIVWGETE